MSICTRRVRRNVFTGFVLISKLSYNLKRIFITQRKEYYFYPDGEKSLWGCWKYLHDSVLLYRLAFSKTTRYLSFRKKSPSSHMRDERHKLVLLHILLTVGWQSAKWRPPLSLSLISIDLHDTLLSSPSSAPHKSVSEREKSLEHFGR